jgi:signal transduction histidine kinase/ActR/RegA family two-component response regulator
MDKMMAKKSQRSGEALEAYVKKLEIQVGKALRTEAVNRVLFDIATAQNTCDTLQQLYTVIHQILSGLMDMTNFYIAIYYRDRNAIRFVYHIDKYDPHKVEWIENFTRDPSLTGDVILAEKPLLLKEDQLRELASQGRVKGVTPKVWLGVPLVIRGEVMGVMAVQNYVNPDQFNESDVEILTFVSEQIALSIEKKRAQSQLQQVRKKLVRTEKLEAIGTLAGGIAHDFNNTLSVTLGNINLAQMMVSDPELLQILSDAETGVMQAKELASRFIVFARGGVMLKEKTDSRQYLSQTLRAICEKAGILYRLKMGKIPETIEISRSQMKEVIKNVVINAHEAMDRSGEVLVSFCDHPQKEGVAVISVTDQGKGMAPALVEKVFEPYYSTKPFGKDRGTGLGMSIAYSIVKSHQGEIQIRSTPGKGTQVDIILPVSQDQETGKKESPAPSQPPRQDQHSIPFNCGTPPEQTNPDRILIMDDDPMILDVSVKLLERIGYDGLPAQNGEQAIQIYEQALQDNDPVRCVILDLEVKQGMGGAETVRALKKIDPDVKAILASGYSSDKIMENCQDHGFDMAIAKPYSMSALKEALERLCPPGTPGGA